MTKDRILVGHLIEGDIDLRTQRPKPGTPVRHYLFAVDQRREALALVVPLDNTSQEIVEQALVTKFSDSLSRRAVHIDQDIFAAYAFVVQWFRDRHYVPRRAVGRLRVHCNDASMMPAYIGALYGG